MLAFRIPALRVRPLVFRYPSLNVFRQHRLYSARVQTSVRTREEFFRLLATQETLIANFCILTDHKGKLFSGALFELGKHSLSEKTAIVDVELDEGDVNEVALEFVVSESPTIVAFNREQKIASFTTSQHWDDPEALRFQLSNWLKNLQIPL